MTQEHDQHFCCCPTSGFLFLTMRPIPVFLIKSLAKRVYPSSPVLVFLLVLLVLLCTATASFLFGLEFSRMVSAPQNCRPKDKKKKESICHMEVDIETKTPHISPEVDNGCLLFFFFLDASLVLILVLVLVLTRVVRDMGTAEAEIYYGV